MLISWQAAKERQKNKIRISLRTSSRNPLEILKLLSWNWNYSNHMMTWSPVALCLGTYGMWGSLAVMSSMRRSSHNLLCIEVSLVTAVSILSSPLLLPLVPPPVTPTTMLSFQLMGKKSRKERFSFPIHMSWTIWSCSYEGLLLLPSHSPILLTFHLSIQ